GLRLAGCGITPLLEEGAAQTLRDPADDLAFDDARVDLATTLMRNGVAQHLHQSGAAVYAENHRMHAHGPRHRGYPEHGVHIERATAFTVAADPLSGGQALPVARAVTRVECPIR